MKLTYVSLGAHSTDYRSYESCRLHQHVSNGILEHQKLLSLHGTNNSFRFTSSRVVPLLRASLRSLLITRSASGGTNGFDRGQATSNCETAFSITMLALNRRLVLFRLWLTDASR